MKIQQHKIIITLIFIFLLVFQNCRTLNYNKVISKSEMLAYEQNDPLTASKDLIQYVNKNDENQLIFMMEAGNLLQMAKKYKISNKLLGAADKKADALRKSLSKEALSLLSNESGKTYRGEDFERILVNMIAGINYLKLKNYDDALVEFKKVNYKIDKIRKQYKSYYKINIMAKYLASVAATYADDLDYAYIELKQINKIKPGIPIVIKRMLYLTKKLGYKSDYRRLQRRYRQYQITRSLKGKGEIFFVYQSGLSPIKMSRGRMLDDIYLKRLITRSILYEIRKTSATGITLNMAMLALATAENPIPKYLLRKTQIKKAVLKLSLMKEEDLKQNSETDKVDNTKKDVKKIKSDEEKNDSESTLPEKIEVKSAYPVSPREYNIDITSSVLNNVESTILKNFEQSYNKMRTAMVSRIVVKLIVSLVAQKAAEAVAKKLTKNKAASWLIGAVVGAGTAAIAFGLEKPDLRCWHTLPANYQAGSKILPIGKYYAKVILYDNQRNIIREEIISPIEVKKNQPAVVNIRTVK